jgi:hypothetical protein
MYEHTDNYWSIAVFAARETLPEMMATLDSVLTAARKPAVIDLLINGNEQLAISVAERIASRPMNGGTSTLRVWFITLGDKGHAWNQYIHFIQPRGQVVFFLDGYVHPDCEAFDYLGTSLLESSKALGATGLPRMGRSALRLRQEMIQHGGIHGNLFCLKGETVRRIVGIGFRLPLGIYRTDPTLGAALMFNLDPAHYDWDPARILVNPYASWSTKKRNWWRFSDLKDQAKRMLRQAQGVLENRAVRQHFAIRHASPADLPKTAAELVLNWVANYPGEARKISRRNLFLYQYTLNKFRQPRNWEAADVPPRLIHTQGDL